MAIHILFCNFESYYTLAIQPIAHPTAATLASGMAYENNASSTTHRNCNTHEARKALIKQTSKYAKDMKHYTKPTLSVVTYADLMDERIIVGSNEAVDPSQGLSRRFTDSWELDEEASPLHDAPTGF